MRSQSAAGAARPATQLPHGPYPASTSTIWAIAAWTVLIGLMLAVFVPAALSSGEAGPATPGVQPPGVQPPGVQPPGVQHSLGTADADGGIR